MELKIMNNIVTKIGVAGTTSLVLTETLNLNTIYNALITLAVSILSVLSVEGINYLRKLIVYKTKKLEENKENKKDEK